jgi:hypothetical protein
LAAADFSAGVCVADFIVMAAFFAFEFYHHRFSLKYREFMCLAVLSPSSYKTEKSPVSFHKIVKIQKFSWTRDESIETREEFTAGF